MRFGDEVISTESDSDRSLADTEQTMVKDDQGEPFQNPER
jgi:hypothetical protein